jgi:hypothetical protein
VPISVPEGFSFGTIEGCFNLPEVAVDTQNRRWLKALSPRTGDGLLTTLARGAGSPHAMRAYVKRNLDVKYCFILNQGDIPFGGR